MDYHLYYHFYFYKVLCSSYLDFSWIISINVIKHPCSFYKCSFYDSLYYYSNLTVIKTYRHYVKEIMGWTISVDVIQASTYIEICDDHKGG
jgi:hypothetical protein